MRLRMHINAFVALGFTAFALSSCSNGSVTLTPPSVASRLQALAAPADVSRRDAFRADRNRRKSRH